MNAVQRIFLAMIVFAAMIAIGMFCALTARAADIPAPVIMMGTKYCDLPDDYEKSLRASQESMIGMGIGVNGRMVRVFKGDHSWTVVETEPNGFSCTLNSGDDWDIEKQGDPT